MTEERESAQAPPQPLPPPGPPEPPERPEPRRLTRSRRDRLIAGVGGGLAEYFGIDPTIVRILIVISVFFTGGMLLLLYLAAWIVMPEPQEGYEPVPPYESSGDSSRTLALGFGVLLVLVGLWALLWTLDIPAPPWQVVLSVLLILTGAGVIATGGRGAQGTLVTLALVLTVVLAVGSLTFGGFRWESGFGERTERPAAATQVQDSYRHAFGSMTVDLRGLDFAQGTTRIDLDIAFGELIVRLPPGVEYRVEGRTSFGSTQVEGQEWSGISSPHSYQTQGYAGASTRLLLDIRTSFGSTQVRR
jgi:phage shock protein C